MTNKKDLFKAKKAGALKRCRNCIGYIMFLGIEKRCSKCKWLKKGSDEVLE